jgi:ABC-type branched-subunit amino acid transport system substrate-binding protein
LAVLLPVGSARPESVALNGALALAVHTINSKPEILRGRRLDYVWIDDACGRSQSLAGFSEMLLRFGRIDCLIGPGCDEGCEATAPLAEAKHIPQISPVCRAASLSDKRQYPLFARTTSPYTKRAPAIVALMQWAAWTRVSVIGDVTMAAIVWAFRFEVGRSGLKIEAVVQYQADHVEATLGLPSALLVVQVAGVRIVMVFALGPEEYPRIAVEARSLDMGAGWAWLALDLVSGAEYGANGAALAGAQEALNGWVYFAPHVAADGTFFDQVQAAPTADVRRHLLNATSARLYAANLYDAVMLYAIIAGAHLDNLSDGTLIAKALRNASFDGMTGRVELDENGDMVESIRAMNCVRGPDGAMEGRTMGVYDALNGRYSPLSNYTPVWPGGVGAVPTDTPPTTAKRFDTVWLFVGAIAAATLVMGGLALLMRKKRAKLQAVLMMLVTETSQLVGTVLLELADLATDCITCYRIQRGDVKAATEGYQAAYATVLAFGVVGTAVSVTYRFQSALLVRDHVQALVLRQGRAEVMSETRLKAEQHEWELAQTHRTKVWLMLDVMTILAQGAFGLRVYLLLCPSVRPNPLPRQICRRQSLIAA